MFEYFHCNKYQNFNKFQPTAQSYKFTSHIAAFLSMVLITEMLEICIQTSYDQNVQLILKCYLPVVLGTTLKGLFCYLITFHFIALAWICCRFLGISEFSILEAVTINNFTNINNMLGSMVCQNIYIYISACVFVLFLFILCTLCCQFLWIVHFWFPLRYSLTFIYKQIM